MTTLAAVAMAAGMILAHRHPADQSVAMPAEALQPVPVVRGSATWYATGPGVGRAAAGSELRRALGRHWRGTVVLVCRRGTERCRRVRLIDWCGCPGPRVVDIAPGDFRRLAPLWRGVVRVRVVLP